jgi:hypothetical protein
MDQGWLIDGMKQSCREAPGVHLCVEAALLVVVIYCQIVCPWAFH